jgi:hypothetical protein
MEFFRSNQRFDYAGKRYEFAFKSSYLGEVDYMVSDSTGTFRATLRHGLGDYERSILNGPDVVHECETAIGLLIRCVCDNGGEVLPETVAAFNAWRAAEAQRMADFMKARPERFGADIQTETPMLAAGGYWQRGEGWIRRETLSIAA